MNEHNINEEKSFSIPTNANAMPKNIDNIILEEDNDALNALENRRSNFLKFYKYNKFAKSSKFLSLLFGFFGTGIFLLLIYPLSKIFAGEWKLRQQIDFFTFEKIELGSRDWNIKNFFGNGNDLLFYIESAGSNVSIRYYGILIFVGLISGYFLSLHLAKKSHVATSIIDRMLIGLIVFGLIGARLFFVAFNWEQFSANPESIILSIQQGGLSIFGALIGAFLYLILYVNRFRFNLWEFLDILAPGVLLGQIIGRWGNFFNYEAYGPATTVYWKMFVPLRVNLLNDLNSSYFHPTFLYEIIPNFILLLVVLYFYDQLTFKRSGLIFAIYACGYGFVRFITEFYRLDALTIKLPFEFNLWIYNINSVLVSQLVAIGLFLFGFFVFIKRRRVVFLKKNLEEIRF